MTQKIPERVQAVLEGRGDFTVSQLTAEEQEIYFAHEGEALEKYETPAGKAWKAMMDARVIPPFLATPRSRD